MKAFKKGVKWGAYKFVPKAFNLIVILTLVLQPAGTSGIWNIAFAQSVEPDAPIVEEVVPAPEPVKEEKVAPVAEKEVITPPQAEEIAPVSPGTAPTEPVSDTPTGTTDTTTLPSEETPATSPEIPISVPSVGDTGSATDTPSNNEETTVTSPETPTPTEETAPTDTPPATEPVEAPVSQETPVEEAASVATEPVDETVCLAASVEGDSAANWTIDEEKNTAVTNGAVELGVRYVYPLDKEVSVTFTCLPKDESKRAPLSIERIKASDINLPDGVSAASEYAYDITTDGMENGDFKYNLVLPKSEVTGAEVKYIEQSAVEVVASDVAENELKAVDENSVKEENDSVTVSDLDHFTIFTIVTYADFGMVTNEITYLPGDTVYAKATVPSASAYYRIDIIEQNGTTTHPTTAVCVTGGTSPSGSYVLSTSAPVGTNWKARVTEYSANDCNAGSQTGVPMTADFAVVAYNTSAANPTIPQTCGLDIALVIDHSGSINETELGQMKTALTGFVTALTGTPTQFSVTTFNYTASVMQPFTDNATLVTTAINSVGSVGVGATNWQDAFSKARSTFTPDPSSKPNLMIFATDGNPTYPSCGGGTTCALDVNAAITEANAAKASNIRILALGIGDEDVLVGLSDGLHVENLKAISGHTVNASSIMDSDVITTDFSGMAAKLSAFARETCGGTVTVTKKIDADGDLLTTDDQTVASGWTFNVGGHVGQVTDATGKTAAITLAADLGYSVTETPQAGYTLADATCTGAADNGARNGDAVTGITINDNNIVACTFINTPNRGSIELKKDWVGTPGNTTLQIGTSAGGTQVDTQPANGADATTGVKSVNTGTYYVSETSVGSNYDTTLSCVNGQTPVTVGQDGAVSVTDGAAVVCTFTNTFTGKPNLTVLKTNNAGQTPAVSTPFVWKLHIANAGTASASFGNTQTIITDNLPAGATYGTPAVSNASGVTGTIGCGTITANNLNCTATSAVTIGVGGSFDVTFTATPNASGTFSNPRNGGICVVDPNNSVPESNEGDNTCSDTVRVLPTTLAVYKVCDPAGDTGLFNLQIDGVNKTTDTVCGGWTNGQIEVTVGSHTVGEIGGSGTNLANYISVISGDCASNGSVTLAAGEHKSCTITNTKQNPALTIVKTATPTTYDSVGDVISYSFLVTNSGNVSLTGPVTINDDKATNESCPAVTTVGNLDNELDPSESITCTASYTITLADLNAGSVTNIASASTDGTTSPTDTETVDSVAGKIIVEKQTNPDQSEEDVKQAFTFNPSWSEADFTLVDNGQQDSGWLALGTYSVTELEQLGWELADATCVVEGQERVESFLLDTQEVVPLTPGNITLGAGEIIHCTFTNTFVPPVLQVSKANDSGAPETPGNDVLYTITVTAPEGNATEVADVHVTDLPPAGFIYRSGSWTASSSDGSHIGMNLSHTYASPGVWSLGTMKPGEVITLTYLADISGTQDAGTYEDLAFARGTSAVDDPVLADCVGSCQEEGSTPFTGTDVEVVLPVAPAAVALANTVERNVDTQTIHRTKRVLGAATVLPSTGSSINTVLFALMLLLGGLILLLLSKRSTWLLIRSLSKSMVKVFLFAILVGTFLGMGNVASAASTLDVQIETPKAQVSDPNFKIGFVVLDILGRAVTVDCEKKGPSDVSFSVFESQALLAGGTSGDCAVDDSVMTADGTYLFRVTATAGSDSETAGPVSVKLISGTPSTPLNYSRASGSCMVSFTTANDGLTDTVELYRSLSSTFTADASTFVDDIAILPNTSGTITDTNGDCGGSYFYAIRAVAASGLGSGFVGDERVVIDNEHQVKYKTDTKHIAGKTTTTGAIPVTTGGGAGTGTEGTVEGAATTGEEEGIQSETGAEGSVLGEETGAVGDAAGGFLDRVQSHPWWSLLGFLALIALFYYAHQAYLGKQNENNQPK